MTDQTKRLRWLDVARACAAFAVLASHTIDSYWRGYADYIQFGNGAVVLFFLVSGYIIPMSLEHNTLPRFWLRRIFRLYPLYCISIIVYVVAGMSQTQSTREILINFSMLQPYLGAPYVSSIYWSLVVEVAFYALLTVLLVCNLHRATVHIFFVLAIACLILTYTGVHWVLNFNFIYLPICVAGTFWYRFDQGLLERRHLHILILAIIVYIIAIPIEANWLVGWLVAVGAFSLIHKLRNYNWPAPLVWCGTISYSTYLLHPLVLHFMPGWGFIFTLIVATTTYILIERQFIDLGRRIEHYIERRHHTNTPISTK